MWPSETIVDASPNHLLYKKRLSHILTEEYLFLSISSSLSPMPYSNLFLIKSLHLLFYFKRL